jgi:integrase
MIMKASAPRAEGGREDIVLAMAIAMASMTGARRGELCGLRWDDIDPEACTIRIERQWVAARGGQHLADPKTSDGKRTVWLGVEGMAIIERFRGLMAALTDHEPFGWLLSPDATEGPMGAKSLAWHIATLAEGLGLKATTHSFRRVAATELVAAGVDVDTAARRMRHTKEVICGSYVLGAADRQVAAATMVEARLIEQGLPLAELLPYRKAE